MSLSSASGETPSNQDQGRQLLDRALTALSKGAPAQAEQLLREYGAILLARHGPLHLSYAENLSRLATVCQAMDRYQDARELLLHALDVLAHAKGPQHPLHLSVSCHLATLHLHLGDCATAEQTYHAVLRRQKSLPDQPMPVAQTLSHLAWFYASRALIGQSLSAMRESERYRDRMILRLLGHCPEGVFRESLREIEASTDLFMSIGLEYFPKTHDAIGALWGIILRRKGLSMECSLERRLARLEASGRSGQPHRKALTRLRADLARKFLAQYRNIESPDTLNQELHDQTAELRELEMTVSRASWEMLGSQCGFAVHDVAHLAQAIPTDSALVEFVKYRRYKFSSANTCSPEPSMDFRYAAFVLRGGEPRSAQLIDLGNASILEDLINAHLRTVKLSTGLTSRGLAFEHESNLPAELPGAELKQRVFDPLLPCIQECSRLILIMDGELPRLSVATLPLAEPNSYLIDRYCIRHVDSVGELISRHETTTPKSTQSVVIAAPPCAPQANEATWVRRVMARVTKRLGGLFHTTSSDSNLPPNRQAKIFSFDTLPGTDMEGRLIAAKIGARFWQEPCFLGYGFERLLSPKVLHVATHGFFLPKVRATTTSWQTGNGPQWLPPPDNPMVRSGLAFAGTHRPAGSCGTGAESGDGLLTAQEISLMDLRGTRLVVLSGCQTGLGETTQGDGVIGLRRAFSLAGAQSLVISLWKVDDVASTLLMVRFYDNLIDRQMPMDNALRDAQQQLSKMTVAELSALWAKLHAASSSAEPLTRATIAEYLENPLTHRPFEHPFYWGAFILSGKSSTLSFGQPN